MIPQERRLHVDWKKLKTEYIAGGTSYRKLAEKYDVPFGTLRKIAAKEKWTDLRSKTIAKADTKIIESVSNKQADKAKKILDVADKLLDKISATIDQMDVIDSQSIKHFTSALKDLKDIKGIKSEVDLREQEARIAKLQKDAESEEKDNNEIKVVIESSLEKYSE